MRRKDVQGVERDNEGTLVHLCSRLFEFKERTASRTGTDFQLYKHVLLHGLSSYPHPHISPLPSQADYITYIMDRNEAASDGQSTRVTTT
jgi:hypothetical protein